MERMAGGSGFRVSAARPSWVIVSIGLLVQDLSSMELGLGWIERGQITTYVGGIRVCNGNENERGGGSRRILFFRLDDNIDGDIYHSTRF
jgi:hypothetical protein